MKKATIQLETLTCPSCLQKIENATKSLKGVQRESVKVLFNASKVKLEFDGELELGADAVGARNQHGLFVTIHRYFEQRAEAAQAAEHAGALGARDRRLDAFDQGVAGIDVDAGVAVTQGSAGGGGRLRVHEGSG